MFNIGGALGNLGFSLFNVSHGDKIEFNGETQENKIGDITQASSTRQNSGQTEDVSATGQSNGGGGGGGGGLSGLAGAFGGGQTTKPV
jgi:hypothetical protein